MLPSWRPSEESTGHDLDRAQAHYAAAVRKVIAVLKAPSRDGCLAVVERIQERGQLLHPYLIEWFNRQRQNLEGTARSIVFDTFDELPAVERRILASSARRATSFELHGIPFDLETRSTDIPHAARHLRSIAAEAYGSTEFETLRLVEEPDPALCAVTRDAWGALAHFWPEAAGEVRGVTQTMSYFSNDFLVGGALQCFLGGIFLTRRRAQHGIQLGEEILHESSHTRLFYMMIGRVLWTNPEDEKYETVLRKDRRPFWGLFHQLFVLTRLAEYYRRVIVERPEFAGQYREICAQAGRAVKVVEEVGQLTSEGRELFSSIAEGLRRHEALLS